MCPQQLDHKPHNHPNPNQSRSQGQDHRVVTGDHKLKMLASTVQFSTNTQPPPHPTGRHPHNAQDAQDAVDAVPVQVAVVPEKPPPPERVVFSGPNRVSTATTNRTPQHPLPPHSPTPETREDGGCTRPGTAVVGDDSPVSPPIEHPGLTRDRGLLHPFQDEVLLRKEVIQPHLPVRLPCYDFVPIASPTFDGSLPQGVGPPASGVADFRDVTGGVYKARERIHRSVADLRLLATPTSRGRVADPDPN
jgi:hypothetical protein